MRLMKLGVLNYRAFGDCGNQSLDPTDELIQFHEVNYNNDIILIAGENNIGKTCLLCAYRDFRTSSLKLTDEDFHNKQTDKPIIMELAFQAEESDDLTDDRTAKWFHKDTNIARVRKIWSKVGASAEKYSWEPNEEKWIKDGFGGFDSILQSKLPDPIHIRPDMKIDELKSELQKLFKEIVKRYIEQSDTVKSINDLLQTLSYEIESDAYINAISTDVSSVAQDIFPGTTIKFENPVSDKGILPLLDKQADVSLTVDNSPELKVDKHGHGSQRVFMLSALSVLAEKLSATPRGRGNPNGGLSGKLIQIEEPELFLSPSAVRKMKNLVYKLAAADGVQVMACTHSPLMIDFSRPKQTLVLVEKSNQGSVIRQSENSGWGKDQKETLKLMYEWNPAFSEALFAKKVVLVEGETEFAAVTKAMDILNYRESELDIHIINCHGKGTLQHFQRLLRDVNKRYMVVHDLDVFYDPTDIKNMSDWNKNEVIWQEIKAANDLGCEARGFAFVPDFEIAHNYVADKPKMLNAIKMVERAHTENSLQTTVLHSLLEAIRNWNSSHSTLETLRGLKP